MVTCDETCKVGDFGLLRELPKDEEIYVSVSKSPAPIRWMAPESLQRREFSIASDVWSYGVLLWEICQPTALPYEVGPLQEKKALRVIVPKKSQDVRLLLLTCE